MNRAAQGHLSTTPYPRTKTIVAPYPQKTTTIRTTPKTTTATVGTTSTTISIPHPTTTPAFPYFTLSPSEPTTTSYYTSAADNSTGAEGEVRLVNGNRSCVVRVDVYHAGLWGTVCDDSWDIRDANVVCRQLDCELADSAFQNAAFGQGSGPIWLDDVSCYGNETSITDCRHRGLGLHDCGHFEDASLICYCKWPHV